MYSQDVNRADFEGKVVSASFKQPAVVDYRAPWCAPCKSLKPILEKLAGWWRSCFRCGTAGLLVVSVMLMTGCATTPDTRLTPNRFVPDAKFIMPPAWVAVVYKDEKPKVAVQGLRGWVDTSEQAAGAMLRDCFFYVNDCPSHTIDGKNTPPSWHCQGGGGGGEGILYILALSGVCSLTAAPMMATVGAIRAPSKGVIRSAKQNVVPKLSSVQAVQDSLRSRFMEIARADGRKFVYPPVPADDYGSLAASGIDTVLELTITDISLQTDAMFSHSLDLTMKARARLVLTDGNREIFHDDYVYHGESGELPDWSADHGKRLAQALNTGYETLAHDIYDNIFLLYPYPDRDFDSGTFGLAPQVSWDNGDEINSLRPVLKWESFPRKSDIAAKPEDMKRVKDVRYDLYVAREAGNDFKKVVYRRNGLTHNVHKVRVRLAPDTRYAWSVRAHFKLDGRERVTEWSLPVEGEPYSFVFTTTSQTEAQASKVAAKD